VADATPGRYTVRHLPDLTISLVRSLSIVTSIRTEHQMSDEPADPQLLLHPVRIRLVVAFVGGGPMTASQLAVRLSDVPKATLYRHLNALAAAGVVSVIGERRVRGAVERTYALEPERARIGPADLASASPEQLMQAFTTFVAVLLSDYAAYVRTPDRDPNQAAYFVTPLQLTDQQFAALGAELRDGLQRAMANPPEPTSRRFTFATVVIPDASPNGDPS
jgi:DNA-binding transcriptional ArsR family regulator